MESNHNHVSTALRFMAGVETARRDLLALYDQQSRGEYSNAIGQKVAEKHQTIGYGMKMADLHLKVAHAGSLERLADRVAPGRDVTL